MWAPDRNDLHFHLIGRGRLALRQQGELATALAKPQLQLTGFVATTRIRRPQPTPW